MKLLLVYSVRNVWARSCTTALSIGGLALVSLILLAVLMLGNGLNRALIESGSPDNVLLLRKGATTEIASGIYRDQAHVVRMLAGIAQTSGGELLAIPELVVLISLAKSGAETPANVVVRGTQPEAFRLRPQVRLIAGRACNRARQRSSSALKSPSAFFWEVSVLICAWENGSGSSSASRRRRGRRSNPRSGETLTNSWQPMDETPTLH